MFSLLPVLVPMAVSAATPDRERISPAICHQAKTRSILLTAPGFLKILKVGTFEPELGGSIFDDPVRAAGSDQRKYVDHQPVVDVGLPMCREPSPNDFAEK